MPSITRSLFTARSENKAAEVGPLKGIAGIYVTQNESAKALDAYSQALAILRQLGDRGGEAMVLQASGEIYLNLREPQKVLDLDNQALAIYRDLKDQNGEAGTLLDLGLAYFRQLYLIRRWSNSTWRFPSSSS